MCRIVGEDDDHDADCDKGWVCDGTYHRSNFLCLLTVMITIIVAPSASGMTVMRISDVAFCTNAAIDMYLTMRDDDGHDAEDDKGETCQDNYHPSTLCLHH